MDDEIQDKINLLLFDLAQESEKYEFALNMQAGFEERRKILKQIRVIKLEIEILEKKLKSLP